MRLAGTAAVVALVVSITGAAQAQDRAKQTPAGDADQLFEEARELLKNQQYEQACAKFEASYAIEAATGTLINLARCYEQSGKLATAWRYYGVVAKQASASGQDKRAAFARTRVAALLPRLARLLIRVPESSRISGLTVTRDDTLVRELEWGGVIYVDRGEYRIAAEAPEHRPFTRTVTAEDGREVVIEIPRLSPTDGAQSDRDQRAQRVRRERRVRPDPGRNWRIAGISTTAGGTLAIAAGLGFAVSARGVWDDAFELELCERETLRCTDAGQILTDQARSRADAGTVLLAAGGVLIVTGVALYVLAPKRPSATGKVTAAPMLGPDRAGLMIAGGF